jgi:hypothetical protein
MQEDRLNRYNAEHMKGDIYRGHIVQFVRPIVR